MEGVGVTDTLLVTLGVRPTVEVILGVTVGLTVIEGVIEGVTVGVTVGEGDGPHGSEEHSPKKV
jgi:hypothetical protein